MSLIDFFFLFKFSFAAFMLCYTQDDAGAEGGMSQFYLLIVSNNFKYSICAFLYIVTGNFKFYQRKLDFLLQEVEKKKLFCLLLMKN